MNDELPNVQPVDPPSQPDTETPLSVSDVDKVDVPDDATTTDETPESIEPVDIETLVDETPDVTSDNPDDDSPLRFRVFIYTANREEVELASEAVDGAYESFNDAVDFAAEEMIGGYKITDTDGNVLLSVGS